MELHDHELFRTLHKGHSAEGLEVYQQADHQDHHDTQWLHQIYRVHASTLLRCSRPAGLSGSRTPIGIHLIRLETV